MLLVGKINCSQKSESRSQQLNKLMEPLIELDYFILPSQCISKTEKDLKNSSLKIARKVILKAYLSF